MKFQKNVKKEIREELSRQLREYEQGLTLTKKERQHLYEWVSSGHSPYENEDCLYDGAFPLDFISALRFKQAFMDKLKNLSAEEQENEIRKISCQYDTVAEDIAFDISDCLLTAKKHDDLPF